MHAISNIPFDEIEIGRSDNHLGFRSATTQVFTRLIEGPYPNYEQVIPRENDKFATAEKATLISALVVLSVMPVSRTINSGICCSGSTKL